MQSDVRKRLLRVEVEARDHQINDDFRPEATGLVMEAGFTVCGEAVGGFDALEKVRSLSPDLIILDLSMPRMNGLQTAREIRAKSIPVPIILFTMYAEELRPQDAEASGISAVVSKTDLGVLQQQIERLLVPAS